MTQTSVQGLVTGLGGAFIAPKVATRRGSSKVFAHHAQRG
jgi:hypothetical protein